MMPKKYNTNSFENIFQVSLMYMKHNNNKVKGKNLMESLKSHFGHKCPDFTNFDIKNFYLVGNILYYQTYFYRDFFDKCLYKDVNTVRNKYLKSIISHT